MSSVTFGLALVRQRGRQAFRLNMRLLSQLQQTEPAKQLEETSLLYPPVKPRFPPGLWGEMTDINAWKWHEKGEEALKIANLQERLAHLSDQSRQGYWQASPFLKRRHALDGVQYMTKSRVQHSLPSCYQLLSSSVNAESVKIAQALLHELYVQDAVVKENESSLATKKLNVSKVDASCRLSYIRQLAVFLSSISASQHSQVERYQVSERPSIESAWQRCGYKHPDVRTTTKDEGGIRVQVSYKPDILLRGEHPLVPVLKTVDDILSESEAGPIPEFTYSPNNLGMYSESMKPSWLPGFRLDDPCEFGVLQVIDVSSYLSEIETPYYFQKHPHIVQELLEACAVVTGFTWASSLAHYQGFSMLHDVTYPFYVQTILTDTRRFMLSTFQLNTLSLFKDANSPNGNLRENACWTTNLMHLYPQNSDKIPEMLSDEVIRLLISFFSYPSDAQNFENRRPYLPQSPSPLASSEPLINIRIPPEPEVPVVDEFWKI